MADEKTLLERCLEFVERNTWQTWADESRGCAGCESENSMEEKHFDGCTVVPLLADLRAAVEAEREARRAITISIHPIDTLKAILFSPEDPTGHRPGMGLDPSGFDLASFEAIRARTGIPDHGEVLTGDARAAMVAVLKSIGCRLVLGKRGVLHLEMESSPRWLRPEEVTEGSVYLLPKERESIRGPTPVGRATCIGRDNFTGELEGYDTGWEVPVPLSRYKWLFGPVVPEPPEPPAAEFRPKHGDREP